MQAEKYQVSEHNFAEEVRAKEKFPEKIIIEDATLRIAEQGMNIGLTQEEKLIIARKLDELGVHELNIGHIFFEEVRDLIKACKREGINSKIITTIYYDLDWKKNLDLAIDTGADILQLTYLGGDIVLKYFAEKTRDKVKREISEFVEYSKERGGYTMFALSGGSRTSLDHIKEICRSLINVGIDRFALQDTVGVLKPAAMSYLIREMKKTVNVPIRTHCHNSFGLALANSLAAFEAGAEVFSVTVNGLGDKPGITALDEFVMALKCLYGVDVGIKTEMLTEVSRIVEDLTKVKIPYGKPIVGRNAFAYKFDMHTERMVKNPFSVQPFDPDLVGNRNLICIGKGTGPFTLKLKAREMGLYILEERIPHILKRIYEEATRKKRDLSDEELMSLVEKE